MSVPTPATSDLLRRIFRDLDYRRLGPIYCDEGGDEFWRAHRGPALHCGLAWARALVPKLAAGGVSLYVGAGVAEIPAMVTEVRDLHRRVTAVTLQREEAAILDAACRAAGVDGLTVRGSDAAELTADATADATAGATAEATAEAPAEAPAVAAWDHLSLVSVLNDPAEYPEVSALSYGRLPPVQLDVERFESERGRLRALVAGLLGGMRCPGLVTTTFEEVAWILDGAEALQLSVEPCDGSIDTAIVGDPIGFLRIDRAT